MFCLVFIFIINTKLFQINSKLKMSINGCNSVWITIHVLNYAEMIEIFLC